MKSSFSKLPDDSILWIQRLNGEDITIPIIPAKTEEEKLGKRHVVRFLSYSQDNGTYTECKDDIVNFPEPDSPEDALKNALKNIHPNLDVNSMSISAMGVVLFDNVAANIALKKLYTECMGTIAKHNDSPKKIDGESIPAQMSLGSVNKVSAARMQVQ